jgi:hypothetical protein
MGRYLVLIGVLMVLGGCWMATKAATATAAIYAKGAVVFMLGTILVTVAVIYLLVKGIVNLWGRITRP